MATYDVLGARKAGLSYSDIASYLAQSTEYDLEGARKAGLSDKDIVDDSSVAGPTHASVKS